MISKPTNRLLTYIILITIIGFLQIYICIRRLNISNGFDDGVSKCKRKYKYLMSLVLAYTYYVLLVVI